MSPKAWFLTLFPIVALGGLFVGLYLHHRLPTQIDNSSKVALEFKDNTVTCPKCYMYLVGKKDTAQIVTSDGKTHFFDDVGCAILWLKDQKKEPVEVAFWVFADDSKEYINALNAFYSTDDDTPMKYGFRAYKAPKQGQIDFSTMRLKMLRGETHNNPKVKKQQ